MRRYLLSSLLSVLMLMMAIPVAISAEREALIVWDWWGQTNPGYAAWHAWVEQEFEKANPDIDVQRVSHSWGVYLERFAAGLAAGNPPDVLQLPVAWGRELYEQGVLQNLAGHIIRNPGQHLRNYVPVARPYVVNAGAQFGIPFVLDATTLVYNRAINKEVGMHEDALRSVSSWTEFATMAKKLTKRDADKITRSGYSFWMGMEVFTSWLAGNGTTLYSPDRSTTTFNSKAALETLSFIESLVNEHHVFGDTAIDFRLGQTAISSWGTWAGIELERFSADISFGMATFPKGPSSKTRGVAGWTNMLAIPKFISNTDAAWRYVVFCTDTLAQMKLAQLGAKATPARLDFYSSAAYNQLVKERRWMLVLPEAAANANPIIFYRSVEVNSIANQLFADMMAGKISPTAALSKLDSQIKNAWN